MKKNDEMNLNEQSTTEKNDEMNLNEQSENISENNKKETVSEPKSEKEGMSPEEYIGFLEGELAKTAALADDFKAISQRLKADFENYKKRNASLADEMKKLGQASVFEKLLAVLDNLGRAKEMIKDESSYKGFELIERDILTIFEKFGVKEIEAEGKEFDARYMNAVMREENPEMSGKVLQVFSKGYMFGDFVLRHAMVKVAG